MNAITTAQIPQIKMANGKMTTTSRNIAQVFGKNHKHVIRDIESLDIPQDFAESNFGLCSYKGKNGQSYKMHEVTRDGFTLLAMGFTGSKAMQFKLGYIEAFNSMETELLKKYEQPAIPSTISPEQQRIIQEAVAELAHDNKAYAKYYGALKTHFRVGTYKDILESQLDEALQVLQGVVIVQRAIAAPVIAPVVAPIDDQPNLAELLTAINEPNGASVSTDELTEFMIASMRRLQHRCNYYQSRISSKQH